MPTGIMDEQVSQAYPAGPASANQGQSHAVAHCQGVLQGLLVQWPALAGLLLAGAIKRLTSKQCGQHQAEILAGWVQLLTAQPEPQSQQPSPAKPRGTKRKSLDAEQRPSTSSQLHRSFPDVPQLRHCIQALIKQLPLAEQATAVALQKVLLMLLARLQLVHLEEDALWVNSAKNLAELAQLGKEALQPTGQLQHSQDAQPAKKGAAAVADQQQKLLSSLQAQDRNPRYAQEECPISWRVRAVKACLQVLLNCP